jgi:hypothetical protein
MAVEEDKHTMVHTHTANPRISLDELHQLMHDERTATYSVVPDTNGPAMQTT